jgi:hypothetical protein
LRALYIERQHCNSFYGPCPTFEEFRVTNSKWALEMAARNRRWRDMTPVEWIDDGIARAQQRVEALKSASSDEAHCCAFRRQVVAEDLRHYIDEVAELQERRKELTSRYH